MITRAAHHSRAIARDGFSLLEMLIVVAMIGVLAGLSYSSLARGSVSSTQRRVAGSLVAHLLLARSEALQGGQPVDIGLQIDENRSLSLEMSGDDREKSWDLPGDGALIFAQKEQDPTERLEFTFSPTGRCSMRTFTVRSEPAGGIIFVIEFDPISGEPRLESRDVTEQGGES